MTKNDEKLSNNNTRKWIAMASSIWIQSTAGSLYTFGIYSSALKSSQSYSQSTLDTLSLFKDIGANTGLLAGLLYSSSLPRASFFSGPPVVLAAGAIQSFAGYFLIWLCVVGLIPRPHVLLMCLFMLLAAHAQTFPNTANVVTAVNNFPNFSGTVVGIMKGFLGLSGAILIQVYQTIFMNKPTSFLLMLALLPSLNTMVFMCFVRVVVVNGVYGEKKHLDRVSIVSLVIAAYLMIIIFIQNVISLSLVARVVMLVVLVMLLAMPFVVAIRAQREKSLIEEDRLMGCSDQLDERGEYIGLDPSGYHQVPSGADHQPSTSDCSVQWGENLNLLQAIHTANFWFLFLATACGMGSGLATVNNISQIGEALGYTNSETSTLVSLWSIWNFLGRFGAGYVSDYLLRVKGWARPLVMAITLATMGVGHLVIASGLPGALYAGSVLVGVCYGSQWSLMPTIASEIFGVAHLGTIFNTITIASPLGSYFLSVRVVGYIYDKEVSVQGDKCTGAHCFMASFIIMAFTTFWGFLVALGLFFRTRTFYKHVVLLRFRQSVRE